MARSVAERKYGADIGIGITGTMGNVDPENVAFSEPGKVYFAIATEAENFLIHGGKNTGTGN